MEDFEKKTWDVIYNYFDTNKIFHIKYDWVYLNENSKTVWLNILNESIKLILPISLNLTNIDIMDWNKIWNLINKFVYYWY